MNREGGETFLRLLAETVLRGSLAPAPQPPWASGPGVPGGGRVRMMAVARALTAVRALDADTVEDILADFDLAVSVRQLHEQASLGPAGTASPGTGPPGAPCHPEHRHPGRCEPPRRLGWPPSSQFARPVPPIGAGRHARMKLARSTDPVDPKDPKAPGPSDEGPGHGTDRFVPIGLTGPVSRRGRQRRAVPHVVRAHRRGRAAHRVVGHTHPVPAAPDGPAAPRPDPVRAVHRD